MKSILFRCIILSLLLLPLSLFGQKKWAVTGQIQDSASGEKLFGASVFVKELATGTTTDFDGRYELRLASGKYTLVFSYIGFSPVEKKIDVKAQDLRLSVDLRSSSQMLSAVTITDVRGNRQITSTDMGQVKMSIKSIKQIPTLLGEADIIKAIQLLPGVMSTSEGGSGFSVRGGAPDQNLILLDEATVYNAAHALGFFSVFNNDAIQDVTIYKGDIPVQNGGRLSSVLDVRMSEGDDQRFSVKGGIGLLSSRVTLEAPLFDGKTSVLLAGRRTYFDLFLPLAPNEMAKQTKLFFWDLNAKITQRLSDNDRLFLSAYAGRDIFRLNGQQTQFNYGNQMLSARWNHIYSPRLFSNLTFHLSRYYYTMGMEMDALNYKWDSELQDYGLKLDYVYHLNTNNTLRFGLSSTYHIYKPGFAEFEIRNSSNTGWFDDSTSAIGQTMSLEDDYALENGIYIGNEQKIGSRWALKYGLRLNSFSNIGKDSVYYYDQDYNVTEVKGYRRGEFYHTSWALEPRLGATFIINEASSLKAQYSRTAQFIQMAQNSTGGNPLDMWFPTNPNILPQKADMYALGYFRNFFDNKIETSVEVYYKNIHNCIDFKDHSNVILNPQLYGEIRQGKGHAYGLELLFKIPDGVVNGWVSYTLARSERIIPQINEGKRYLAPYDRTHNLTIVLNWKINERSSISANWVYYTGNAVTFPSGRAIINGLPIPIYTERNDYRMPDYHRLDVSYTLKSKPKPKRRWSYDWNFGLYNAYNRHNAWMINFKQEKTAPHNTYAEMTYLFGIVPSITFNFNF